VRGILGVETRVAIVPPRVAMRSWGGKAIDALPALLKP
jgi:hypothetical protein